MLCFVESETASFELGGLRSDHRLHVRADIMTVTDRQIELLKPYLEGESARNNGEWDLYCPLHEDSKRSASINIKTGKWYCQAGCGGGRVSQLVRRRSEWVAPSTAATNGHARRPGAEPDEEITAAMISGWASALQSDADGALDWMGGYRGLEKDILGRYSIGWDHDRRVYTIPVHDAAGELVALRRYNPRPKEGRRKMWGVRGMNAPHLYPIDQLTSDPVIICGGEWDALATIQAGYPAITRTAAERVWNNEWSKLFAGKRVYICHDADSTGRQANRRVARALDQVSQVYIINLPYKIERKHGKDLSDFFYEHPHEDFEGLIEAATPAMKTREHDGDDNPDVITVLDSFDARRVGEPVRLYVTIKGKRNPGYSVPKHVHLQCSQDAGKQCQYCPMLAADGEADVEMKPDDPAMLELIDAPKDAITDIVRRTYGAQKCNRLEATINSHQAVETLFARPSIEHAKGTFGDYTNMKVVSIGRHNTPTNATVELLGALYPNPRSQSNEFMAWGVQQLETTVDHFDMTKDIYRSLCRFQSDEPLTKLEEISNELARNVTKIYGRPEMHMLMDLCWHSPISFWFRDEEVSRGWIDALILGDTRTGKSEAAHRLAKYYSAGEIINCEAATFAGVIGGLQQYGGGREWSITWGAIPINDRRLVVLDEVSGLSPESISQMSDVRASGLAKITKVTQEISFARTRLLWLSNPRQSKMSDYTWGVQAIPPLIGNNEDIARFDLACAVAIGDVAPEEINRAHSQGSTVYDIESCRQLIRWAWSRTAEDITWAAGSEHAVYQAALQLGKKYVEDPPLIQSANARQKIGRVAIAIAMRLFSTDDGESVIVHKEHVTAAVEFMNRLYEMPTLGYAAKSRETTRKSREANQYHEKGKELLKSHRGLGSFLRSSNSFRRQDIEEVLNMNREEANAVVNQMWDYRMIRKEKGDIKLEPQMQVLLRRVR